MLLLLKYYIIGCIINAVLQFLLYLSPKWYNYKFNQAINTLHEHWDEYSDEENDNRSQLVFERFGTIYVLQMLITIIGSFIGTISIIADIYNWSCSDDEDSDDCDGMTRE